jgi:hypothetical protein
LGCARCHDHKFDPIPTADYYSLAGIFMDIKVVDKYDLHFEKAWTEHALGGDKDEWRHDWLKLVFEQANDQYRLSTKDRQEFFKARMKEIRQDLAKIPVAMMVRESKPVDARINIRGNHLVLGEEVPRRFPRILAGEHQTPLSKENSGRLELARWVASPEHPLTARVIVNPHLDVALRRRNCPIA